ncbi:MAG: DUF1697 domain-containing protein [Vicinamibacterales bacterium]
MASVALLRAVNVAGRNQIQMADLRRLAESVGLRSVRTVLQSGNLVFEGGGGDLARLEARLERAAAADLGLSTTFLVRSAAEWQAIVRSNPFPDEASTAPAKVLLVCLKETVASGRVEDLQSAIVGREVVLGAGRHVYIVYPDGVGRSKLTSSVIERRLGSASTARNWNTVLKLREMLGSD